MVLALASTQPTVQSYPCAPRPARFERLNSWLRARPLVRGRGSSALHASPHDPAPSIETLSSRFPPGTRGGACPFERSNRPLGSPPSIPGFSYVLFQQIWGFPQ